MKKNKSGLWNASFGQVVATLKALEDQGLSLEEMALLRSDKVLVKEVVNLIKTKLQIDSVDAIFLAVWQKIYREWFDVDVDISGLQVPENYNPEKHFLVLVAKGITMNTVIAAMRKRFNVHLYTENLDVSVTKNDRTLENGTYIVLFNRNIEVDEEFKNMSADDLAKKGHKGITLFERLLLEVLYYNETKEHLDVESLTLCSGSRHFDDRHVPRVGWGFGYEGLRVYGYDPGHSRNCLRPRSVVSL
ncbi:hypothetical protein CVU82_00155 [Candidatus Falkowbacteria bacterium HGW-Falkowbacteria-1]|jgi:hypothetical protein|uniref:Uncharacterized protein n=1 Tax=Candidatus Falkowbacteria bacterium HGW-Falkowbacteria-1 TaxID=2013768 RepID=A0A2N2EA46_9BACT|nr:MAG: hypothetical protein CVU82_00155 [Candidatus Falkowbacteria bacterium HGW-Falkowbacteria-1]